MKRLGLLALWIVVIPLVGLLACVGPRSLQGPVRGAVELSDGAPQSDMVARLRCFQSGIHGGVGASEALRVFDSEQGYRFLFAWRGFFPTGCNVELLHPLYQMTHHSLEQRFSVDVGRLALRSWEELLAQKPDSISEADVHRHIFYLSHYYFPAFDDTQRADLARYVPALHGLLDRGLRTLPPMDRDRFGSTKDSLSKLRRIEELTGYERPPEQRALFAAAQAGDAAAVSSQLAAGADPDAWNANQAAAIHLAAGGKHSEVVRVLLDGGADVDKQEEGLGRTALIIALQQYDPETAELLIDRGGDVTLAGGGYAPLIEATSRSTREMVELLIEHGAVANAREEIDLVRAMHGAARGGRTDIVEVLLAAGVPVDVGLPGFTAFMQATWKGKLETAQLLLAAGADPNAVSITEMTPLAYARSEDRSEVVAWLEEIGARE
jgi:ankyrin repeat protein